MAVWRVHVRMPINWHGADVAAGDIVEGNTDNPDDERHAAYWGCFGAWGRTEARAGGETPPSPPVDPENGGDGGEPEPESKRPMSSQHVVGRRRTR